MGLDMYLSKKIDVKNWGHYPESERYTVTVKKGDKTLESINPTKVTKVTEEVGCWRKANAIHRWFVENVQGGVDDCAEYRVPREKLVELHSQIEQVLRSRRESDAQDILPTSEGFFFGNTEYNGEYYDDLAYTLKVLEDILSEGENYEVDYYYQSSW